MGNHNLGFRIPSRYTECCLLLSVSLFNLQESRNPGLTEGPDPKPRFGVDILLLW